jgi:hypothetical protein
VKKDWPKHITVDKRIVKILSEATYEDFPNALRELIVNSYDADASQVNINIDLDKEIITISDNGWGMADQDFNHYLKIAAEPQRIKSTPSGRIRIGKFGVGFVSVFPFFKSYSIEATKKNSTEILYAKIPCSEYFSGDETFQLEDISVQGGTKNDSKAFNLSYTKVTLSGFTKLCKRFFSTTHNYQPRKNSILRLNGIEKLKWKLNEDLPIKYENNKFPEVFKYFSPNLSFDVFLNGLQLFRNIYGNQILESNIGKPLSVGKIKYQYFIATSKTAVKPFEGKYLKIRNLNVGVGSRTNFGLGTEVGGARSRLHQLTGEIHILEGLNELITVSRDNFNFDPDYEELKEFFIKKLAYFSHRLEEEAEIEQFVNLSKKESRISDIKLLKPEVFKRKMDRLKKSEVIQANQIDDIIESQADSSLSISNKRYNLKIESWDYKAEFYPACRIEKNRLVINGKYPLFRSKRYTDIFLKLHVLLINKFDDKSISKNTYKSIVDEILNIFNEYT